MGRSQFPIRNSRIPPQQSIKMNFGEFVDNCTDEEFTLLENEVKRKRHEKNLALAAKIELTEGEKELAMKFKDNWVSTLVMNREGCSKAVANLIVQNYRKYQS